jgi:uncharacterized membrane protein
LLWARPLSNNFHTTSAAGFPNPLLIKEGEMSTTIAITTVTATIIYPFRDKTVSTGLPLASSSSRRAKCIIIPPPFIIQAQIMKKAVER